MATSTFHKKFAVTRNNEKIFIKVITSPANPTLQKSFQSRLVTLSQNSDLKKLLERALNEPQLKLELKKSGSKRE